MKKYVPLAVIALLVIGALAINLGKGNQPEPVKQTSTVPAAEEEPVNPNTIIMRTDGYEPVNLTVKKGDKVTFINRGPDDHWPASDNHPTHQIYSEFDPKKPIPPGSTYEFVFTREGEWQYHDHLFPYIAGKITVTP